MEFGQIIYLIAVVAYFLYRVSSKKKGNVLPEEENATPESPQKGVTFEELLREIREAQTPKLPEVEVEKLPLPKPKPFYSAPKKEDQKQYEEVIAKEVSVAYVAGDQEFSGGSSRRLADDSNRSTTTASTQPIRSKLYDQPQEVHNPYADLVKNPKSFRDAIVLSEILKVKHF